MKTLNQHKIFLLIAVIGTAYRLYFALHYISQDILIADDAYYYFTIARNIVAGFGPTFDRLAPTNGFHPLWLLALLPIYKFFGFSLWLPVQLALTLIAIFDLISGIVIYRILDEKGYRTQALIASAFWFLSPFTVYIGLRGLEASLAVMLALLLFRSVAKIFDSPVRLTIRAAVIPGLLFGLACLARTDYLILLGVPLALLATYRSIKTQSTRVIAWLFQVGAISFVIVLPWFIWNQVVFGSITQVSGAAKLYFRTHFGVVFSGGFTGMLRWFVYNVLAPIVIPAKFLSGEDFQSPRVSLLVILGALILSLLPFILLHQSIRHRLTNSKLTSILILSGGCIITQILLYGVIIRLYAAWYALLFYALLAVLLGIAIPEFIRLFKNRKILISAMITSLIIFNIALHPIFLIRSMAVPMSPEQFYGATLREIANQYPDGAAIGIFNAGAIGYIAPRYGKLTVINLDCLVNNQLFDAAKKNEYLRYITDRVDVFYENPAMASDFLPPDELDSLCKIYTRKNGNSFWDKNQTSSTISNILPQKFY